MVGTPRQILLILAAVACSACASPIASDSFGSEALQADLARAAAMVAADATRLEDLLHDRLTYAHSNGVIDTKGSLIAALLENVIDYEMIETSNPEVRVWGQTAIITGRVHVKVAADRQIHETQSQYLAVYWRIATRWQLVAYQSTALGSN